MYKNEFQDKPKLPSFLGAEVGREPAPVSVELAKYSAGLAERAQSLADRVLEKLHPVMTSTTPHVPSEVQKDSREWPPLFSELRGNLDAVSVALDEIEYAILRTAL